MCNTPPSRCVAVLHSGAMAVTYADVLRPIRSYRLRPEAVELIKAWAAYRNQAQGLFLEALLAKVPLPRTVIDGEATEAASRLRRAHKALLDARNGSETPS